MASVKDKLATCATVHNYGEADGRSWALMECSYCGGTQALVVGYVMDSLMPMTTWYRCVNCLRGSVVNDGTQSPGIKPLSTPARMPETDTAVWEEARACLAVGAYTAAVMICRKLLMHVAVAHDLPAKNEKGRAPTFVAALDHLQEEGIVTRPMRKWIDRVKEVGNEANHELTPTTKEQAMDIASFTHQLLRLAYEIPAMIEDTEPTA
ncbi:DUF4145 domain-containing protein [Nocardia sp. NPDC005978]|uniref:DUF4145 domain-containing protein n=1 Tax=Nocardia sp. NPDC005978 TaxID=3156725 RepID=UPI0033B1D6FE